MTPNIVSTLLCSEEPWIWDTDQRCTVRFKEDGTGELFCGVEFTMLIECQIEWKLHTKVEDIATELPAEIEISMVLTKRGPDVEPCRTPQNILKDEAYQPKTYRLRLEKGSFEVPKRTTYFYTPVYTYRLLWDVSPYPPLEHWSYQDPAEGARYWERKDFYKGDMNK